jgi:hypothetical protein
MKPRRILTMAVALLGLAGAAGAQPSPPAQPPAAPAAKAPTSKPAEAQPVSPEELDYLSCREAWRRSGKSADQFIPMLRTLADQSLSERQLALPNDKETGQQIGKAIVQGCVNDPEEHLSSVVDREVRRVATPKQ